MRRIRTAADCVCFKWCVEFKKLDLSIVDCRRFRCQRIHFVARVHLPIFSFWYFQIFVLNFEKQKSFNESIYNFRLKIMFVFVVIAADYFVMFGMRTDCWLLKCVWYFLRVRFSYPRDDSGHCASIIVVVVLMRRADVSENYFLCVDVCVVMSGCQQFCWARHLSTAQAMDEKRVEKVFLHIEICDWKLCIQSFAWLLCCGSADRLNAKFNDCCYVENNIQNSKSFEKFQNSK